MAGWEEKNHSYLEIRCLLYKSDAADEEESVDLVGARTYKKKKTTHKHVT